VTAGGLAAFCYNQLCPIIIYDPSWVAPLTALQEPQPDPCHDGSSLSVPTPVPVDPDNVLVPDPIFPAESHPSYSQSLYMPPGYRSPEDNQRMRDDPGWGNRPGN
jgi:hypothetical protein